MIATKTRTAYVEVRSQHSIGSSGGGFGGPDTYVAVQIVPEGQEPLKALNRKVAAMRGIKIVYCGEGYQKDRGPRSMLGRAIARADEIAADVNGRTGR